MRFEQLRDEVARAERRVETRLLRAKTNWRVLGTTWREAWTPGRIVIVGLVGGLLFARARPLKRAGGLGGMPLARWIQLATSLSGLVTAFRARDAAETAQAAADDAGQVAGEAADTVEAAVDPAAAQAGQATGPVLRHVSDARRRPEPPWTGEPRAAEAATELSEP
ncbi:hypothetical protein L599_005300000140 [Luteimonas sp. J16]|jgi:hypothetical protein|uniref:hypothetical protein n=1 Tax=unclassified Luteimonas TaxID=2629088 RepID=UPI000478737E|nr:MULTISPECIES: hypothetical protein [unclassified Luteimonas]TWG88405.1 hypothetical protein L599_005300000140 [Luteimonas sp. J16]